MYTTSTTAFGDFEKITIANADTGNSFSIVPSQGACLVDLQLQNTAVLDGYQSGEELAVAKWSKARILLPFPNRLEDGSYEWQGKKYQFPIKEEARQVAVHGFKMHDMPFTFVATQLQKDLGSITCRYQHKPTHAAYPFPFSVTVTYELHTNRGFQVRFLVENEGDTAIPIGLGWHPYFKLGVPSNELELQLPNCKKVEVDNRMLPTGERTTYEAFAKLKEIGDTALDTAFTIDNKVSRIPSTLHATDQDDSDPIISFLLTSREHCLNIWQETGEGRFNFFQVFTPDHRQSVAIEPMTCNVNAFNNKEGLLILEPNAVFSARCGVQLVR